MVIDDPIRVQLQAVKRDLDPDIERDMKAAIVAGLVSCIPVPGVRAAIQNLLDGKAQRNLHRRWVELFENLGKRIQEIKNSIPDPDYFSSDEFQTLLALAWEQLQTTHDKNKRKLLANALANSGSAEFTKDSSKEQYVRVLRDLSPEDIAVLKSMSLGIAKQFKSGGELPAGLSRLTGLGLVKESITLREWNLNSIPSRVDDVGQAMKKLKEFREAMAKYLQQPPVRAYELSGFGRRFLKFLAAEQ